MDKQIQTYVFIDLETTGFPSEQNNKTKITEISLVAVKRQHLLDTRIGFSPRVLQKITLCVNPRKLIDPGATEVSGLSNDLLEFEPSFDVNLFNTLHSFMNLLTKPVCLIAQNGLNFDYPILRNHFEKLCVSFAHDVTCADCFHAFFEITEARKKEESTRENMDTTLVIDEAEFEELFRHSTQEIQMMNERSPPQTPVNGYPNTPIKNHINRSKVRRRFPWSDGEKPKEKFKLKYIYERLLNRPAENPHRAENDCLLALECAVALSTEFVEWVDQNNYLFSAIKPMTIGVPIWQRE